MLLLPLGMSLLRLHRKPGRLRRWLLLRLRYPRRWLRRLLLVLLHPLPGLLLLLLLQLRLRVEPLPLLPHRLLLLHLLLVGRQIHELLLPLSQLILVWLVLLRLAP